jgi:hypothetical protein
MNVSVVAKEFNERAVRQHWHQRCDPTLSFSDPRHAQLLAIWREMAAAKAMPARSVMTPRVLKNFLPNIILGQREEKAPSLYRFRVVGTSLTEILGHITGKRFEETIPNEHLSRWVDVCDMVLESERPWRFIGRVQIRDREYLDAEHLFMPLADEAGEPSFVMGLCRYVPRRVFDNDAWENELASIPGGLR